MKSTSYACVAFSLGVLFGLDGWAQKPAFVAPLLVERQVREFDSSGNVEFATPTVKEYYFGNSLVVLRGGGGRAIVDFEKREYTEADEKVGTYWTLSFSRMKELRERLSRADGPLTPRAKAPVEQKNRSEIKVEEVAISKPALASGSAARHVRASIEGTGVRAEAWFDPSISLGPGAGEALQAFEEAVSGGSGGAGPVSELVRALRTAGKGAFMTALKHPIAVKEGASERFVEEMAMRVEKLEAPPVHLLKLPENMKRVPSPLETLVLFAEEEAELLNRGR